MHRAPLAGFEPAPQLPPAQKVGRATTAQYFLNNK